MDENLINVATASLRNLNNCFAADIRGHFPFEVVRMAQEIGLSAVERAYAEDKKYIIVEAATGAGKSGIAMAAGSFAKTKQTAGYVPGAYVLSPQITLTEQYMKDFGPSGKVCNGLVELKGKSNYTCTGFKKDDGTPFDCEEGMDICREMASKKSKMDDEDVDENPICPGCPYKQAKKTFLDTPIGTVNYAYYIGETTHAGQLSRREMLICDEGHNLEGIILDQVTTTINEWRVKEYGITSGLPLFKETEQAAALNWLTNVFVPGMASHMAELEDQIREAKEKNYSIETRAKLTKKLNAVKHFAENLATFMNDEDKANGWLVWSDMMKGTPTYGTLNIRPLTAVLFAKKVLFSSANKVLIMSATILDFETFMRNLGISKKDAVCVRIPCEFPVESRWIEYMPVGNMSSTLVNCPVCGGKGCSNCYRGKVKSIDLVLPKMAKAVNHIMREWHPTEKGFVPTNSYKVTKAIIEGLDAEQFDRVVTHTSAKGDRNRAQADHFASTNSVLFSPSMSEGLDLKDDHSRFSIMSKVPYPYLDPYVKARMTRDPEWYAWQTALTMVQALGRSNRHMGDYARHYILDEAFGWFLRKNEKMFPDWFLAAIRFRQDRPNVAPWEKNKNW